jgi:regulatory protein
MAEEAGRITAITKQKYSNIYEVFIDGEPVCVLNPAVLAELSLEPGDVILPSQIAERIASIEPRYALEKALGYVAKGMHTVSQVRRYLAERGFHDEGVRQACRRLMEYGYLDDRHFAESFIESRKGKAGISRMKLQRDLHSKGLDDETTRSAISGISDLEETGSARAFLHRYIKTHPGMDAQKARRALYAKGYDGAVSNRVIREVFNSDIAEGDLE